MNHRLIPYAIMGKEMWPKHESNARSRAIIEGEHNRILKFLGGSDQTLADCSEITICCDTARAGMSMQTG